MRALVMGVIGDADRSPEDARREAARLAADGADLVDWGGVVMDTALRAVTAELPELIETDEIATMAVSVVLGRRVIRTHNVRAARRVCDVLAAVQEEPNP